LKGDNVKVRQGTKEMNGDFLSSLAGLYFVFVQSSFVLNKTHGSMFKFEQISGQEGRLAPRLLS